MLPARLYCSVTWLACLAALFSTSSAAIAPTNYVPINSWNVTSSSTAGDNISALSQPGLDTSKWYTIGSKGTLMSTLLEAGVYDETEILFSDNLKNVNPDQFRVPWYYRHEGQLDLDNYQNVSTLLKTNGIASRAEVWLNGDLLADSETQAGAYAGFELDISGSVNVTRNATNVLLVKVWPTDYNRDFALGFVDWNPYPPDNGTGVWRNIEMRQTGPISLTSIRVNARPTLDGSLDFYLDAKNLQKNITATGYIDCAVWDPAGNKLSAPKSGFDLEGGKQTKVDFKAKLNKPQLWWPKQWGEQPLYTIQCNATAKGFGLSDYTPLTKFGIRTVSSTLDSKHNDTTFYVNGKRFQVLGAGYTSDMFLRFDEDKFRTQLQYVLEMGLNTIRLEGKQEHPRLYEMADEMGVMILAGWECCDKWEGWDFNDEGNGEKWKDEDYEIAKNSMRHEAEMMQSHPSMLGFLIGSDFWPDDKATQIYVDALKAFDWDIPIISSASQRGAPDLIGNGGMRMEGPYDWVPPNYWYDSEYRLGSAAGFGSELGAGVGTPELGSLKKFLSEADMDDLWKKESKDKGLYHMSTNVSSFYTRSIYNDALYARYGEPTSLEDYIIKAQMADYEATRAQFDAYISRWSEDLERPATGLIYWMLNNAWPSLHWNLFDYYLHPGGSFYGVKSATGNLRSVSYNYETKTVYMSDRRSAIEKTSSNCTVHIDALSLNGSSIPLAQRQVSLDAFPNSSVNATQIPELQNISQVVLLRLGLTDGDEALDRKVYWLPPNNDVMDWDNSTWYHTPVTKYADFSAMNNMPRVNLGISASSNDSSDDDEEYQTATLTLENESNVPALFVRLNLVDSEGNDVVPVLWEQNYVTLWPGEKMDVRVRFRKEREDVKVEVNGRNVGKETVAVEGRGEFGNGNSNVPEAWLWVTV